MVSSKWWTESVGSIELLKSRVGLVRGIGYKMKIDHRDLRFQSRMTHDLISKFYVDISIVKIDRNICHNGYLSLQQFSSIIFISLYTKRETKEIQEDDSRWSRQFLHLKNAKLYVQNSRRGIRDRRKKNALWIHRAIQTIASLTRHKSFI